MALLEEDAQPADEQTFRFDFLAKSGLAECQHSNESNRTDIMKKYLVYMELPKIKIGDYRKSSCVSGNLIRFHFLLRIAKDEANTVLRLLPIKAYKAPVVNFAVIHRPFLDDDDAKGPIPKSPGVRSPLIQYDGQDDAGAAAAPATDTATAEDIAEDFRSDKPQRELQQMSEDPSLQQQPPPQPQRRPSQDAQQEPQPQAQRRPSQDAQQQQPPQAQRRPSQELQQQPQQPQAQRRPSQEPQQQPQPTQSAQRRPSQDSQQEEPRQLEVESPSRQDMMPPPPPVSPARLLSDDNSTAQTDASKPRQRRPKKYFVYCEIPKVLIGDYRNSSVICSEIIHAHFLMKIAKDEESGQPQLQPIRRYHRPKVNFAVIHRSLIVDDEAIGPIPRSPLKKSPMIREDADDDDDEYGPPRPKDNILHATMGFCYGRLPRSKYELVSQWSMVPTDSGICYPELVLSKAEA